MNVATDYYAHPTAEVSPLASIGPGTKIWNQVQIREEAVIGSDCIISKDVYIDKGVIIGNGVKIQNSVSVYHGVTIEDDVFVGPNATFTNDMFPRADNPDWQVVPTLVKRGASIGANATIVCGVTIGERAMVGAGAVVTKDVPPSALVVGNPARILRWLESSAENSAIKVMLVGLGSMGSSHARILSALPWEFDLRVIADSSPDKRAAAQARYPGVRLIADWQDGLADVDAVVVATPTSSHFSIAAEVLRAGKHCLLEKPCTLSTASSIELFSLAASQERVLQVGHTERFNPAIEALLRLLRDEEVVAISTERLGLATRPSEIDVVFDLAIHDLEIVQAIVGQPAERIAAQGICRENSYEYASALVEYSGGVIANLTVSRLTPWRRRAITVTTKHAVYVADCLARTVTMYATVPDQRLCDQPYTGSQCWQFGGVDALTAQARAFAASIRAGSPPVVSSATVLPAIQIAEEMVRQLELEL